MEIYQDNFDISPEELKEFDQEEANIALLEVLNIFNFILLFN